MSTSKSGVQIWKHLCVVVITLVIYIYTVIWITIINRSVGLYAPKTELFWSYKAWIRGDITLGKEIVSNMVMFTPLGFLFGYLCLKQRVVKTIICSVLFSCIIEALQYFWMKGLLEIDDVISNLVGAIIGWCLLLVIEHYTGQFKHIIVSFTCVGISLICGLIVSFHGKAEDTSSQGYCFQIDNVKLSDRKLIMEGFAFRYLFPNEKVTIHLESTSSGETIVLNTENIDRNDVNEYFLCEFDYTHSGFFATAEVCPNEEYEIIICFPWLIPIYTGTYLTGEKIHFYRDNEYIEPNCIKKLTDNGILRAYRPDYHCWVYQDDKFLYWICDEGFNFDHDSTIIQYHLWTTQEDKLPVDRLRNGWKWDNRWSKFEDYEIHGDFGQYRVMRRELPQEYSITSIMTGYYKNGEWVWQNYFRPIYHFNN